MTLRASTLAFGYAAIFATLVSLGLSYAVM